MSAPLLPSTSYLALGVSHYHQAVMYLRLPEKFQDADSRKNLREEILFTVSWICLVILAITANYHLDHDFSYLKDSINLIQGEIPFSCLSG